MADSTIQVVDDDVVCIESDSEDTQSNTPLYRGRFLWYTVSKLHLKYTPASSMNVTFCV
nr:unnamed protein product [Callosobruchus analis]